MNSSGWLPIVCGTALLTTAPLIAQQNAPHLAYALPAGGRQGTTFQIKVGGQFLPNALGAYISGKGLQVSLVDYSRPMNPMQAMQLREKMQELQKKQAQDAEIQKEIASIQEKLLLFARDRNTNPVLAETITLQVSIAADAEPGNHELHVRTPQGLSNPLTFCVGRLPEFNEKEVVRLTTLPGTNRPQLSLTPTDMAITIPAIVNGRIKPGISQSPVPGRPGQQFTPGDADRYRFQALKGRQLVVAVSARELIPYLADAVPGWFQATITLCDDRGTQLAFEDDYRFHPDPVLHYEIPKDGEYVIEIKDSIFRGREDFVYRIAVGELPFITSIFPLGGPAGARTTVELKGWNLTSTQVTQDAAAPGIHPISVRSGDQLSNRMPFAVDELPELLEKEPNQLEKQAQQVSLPILVNGRIDQPGDADLFRFEGRAGEEVVIEVYARRLNSPLDSILRLTDAAGKQLAVNDDHEDKGAGLVTHHADSWIGVTLPADGSYFVRLGEAQQKGGTEYAYRLRISPPRPDFALRVTPSAINAGSGMTLPLTLYAVRKDGFSGDIRLALKGAPRGFLLTGGLLPAGQDRVRLTLTVPPVPLPEPIDLNLEGRAIVEGREIVRPAVPAEDMMQAFAYRHLVPVESLKLTIARRGSLRPPPRIISDQPVRITPGGTVSIHAQAQIPPNTGNLIFELSEPPEGILLKEIRQAQADTELVLQCDGARIKTGLKGNLIVNLLVERQPPAGAARPQANRQRIPMGTLPAIPFEIVAP